MNQILGLFKYGRKGIPALAEAVNWALNEQDEKRVIAIYPGRFQPMGRHHYATYKALANQFGAENTFIVTSNKMGVNNNDNIGTYIVKSLDKLISEQIPELNRDAKKLLIKRIMEDYYGVIEGEAGPKKVRGLETRQILKVADDPEVNDRVKHLASNYPQYLKKIIFPIEDIIHDFAVEMLRSLKSAFILDSDEELGRQRAEVDKAIKAIEASGNEEAMEILKVQMEKLKNIEGISSAAEGFVFDYDGNTYKFTGGFAPMNQILGLFKYGRKGIPALAEAVNWALNEQDQKKVIAIYPVRS